MIRRCAILIGFLCAAGSLFSQEKKDSILLMTGKVLYATVTGEDSAFVYYTEERQPGKVREGRLDYERVFSYVTREGGEHTVYEMDTTIGNYFSVEEMRYYIYGERDALDSYHANWVLYAALPLAGAGGYLLSSSIFVFAVPFAYVVGTSLPKVKVRSGKVNHPQMLKEPAYILGYERTARSRRMFKALVSGLVGTAIGFTIGQATR